MEHDIDVFTDFCVHCGASGMAIAEGVREECVEGVVGISHIVAQRRLSSVTASILEIWDAPSHAMRAHKLPEWIA